MSESKYKEWILDTIDQLRKRKARPDLERICHMVDRRYGVPPVQTQAEIERLVDAEVVIKVDYKGSTSYRNAAKWAKRSSLSGQVLNSNDVSRSLIDAVRYLEAAVVTSRRRRRDDDEEEDEEEEEEEDDDENDGVSLYDVEKFLLEKNTQLKWTKSKLQVALERESIATNLLKLPNGNYTLFDKRLTTVAVAATTTTTAAAAATLEQNKVAAAVNNGCSSSDKKSAEATIKIPTPTTTSTTTTTTGGLVGHGPSKVFPAPSKKGRPPNKRKRFKKTHGPDFVENYDSSFEEPEPKCDYCLLTAACNCNGKPEELLFCKDCNAKAHPSCMDYSADLAMRSRMSPWQCMDCKTCYVCDDSGDADSMLFCDACDKGYHMSCHVPKITEKPSGKWVCCQCVDDVKSQPLEVRIEREGMEYETEQMTNQTIDGAPGLPTPCDSPVPEAEQNKRTFDYYFFKESFSDNNKENNEIPDASDWSIGDVENYFRGVGFPEQAAAFKEQEIDGKSLLLLKRSDVLTGLSIKLGPALKIYNHVKRLQTRRVDGHLIF